jgi:hypothetical protein
VAFVLVSTSEGVGGCRECGAQLHGVSLQRVTHISLMTAVLSRASRQARRVKKDVDRKGCCSKPCASAAGGGWFRVCIFHMSLMRPYLQKQQQQRFGLCLQTPE